MTRRSAFVTLAPLVFVLSGTFQYIGAGVAVGLFDRMPAVSIAWSRIAIAAVVLVLLLRPWRRHWTRRTWWRAAAFGAVLAGMNIAFYLALEHLPLGTAVAVEFIGPVAVGALTGRGWRERLAIALAAVGVVMIVGVTLDIGGADAALGLAWILLAAGGWAGYIMLGRRVATPRPGEPSGLESLSVSMAVGALLYAPFGLPGMVTGDAPPMADPGLLALLLVVAVFSSVLPYGIDQLVLRHAPTARFSVLLSVFPATALLVGVVMLGEVPTLIEVLGLIAVSAAIALTSQREPAHLETVVPPE
ncbi:EamA family transporter [Demequina sp.]|uniref:EamA family transporter n=1 Tax=Demequina sp. TaxID=2050685 RepID=UPI0025C15C07|nr:EamA family transporter [Demequina sp.]